MDLFQVYPLMDIELVRGEGSFVYDSKGRKYLDFYGGHAVISIGHSHALYIDKINAQLSKLGFYSNSVQNPLQKELAQKLGDLSHYSDYQLFLCNSGAEAVENALKIASFHNQKSKVISFKNSFHGRTSGAVSVTDNPRIQAPFNRSHQVTILDLEDQVELAAQLKRGDVTAVILEGIQGIAGINIPSDDFLNKLDSLCKEFGAVLILDEIQSGYGRSGRFFAHQYSNIKPDLVTVAKGMANGFPIGGLLISPRFEASYGLLGTTFGGNHLACAAAIAVLDVISKENLVENAFEMGKYFKDKLENLNLSIRRKGKGLMQGLDLGFPIKALRQALVSEMNILTGSSSDPNVLRILPPLNTTTKEIDIFWDGFEAVYRKIETEEHSNVSGRSN